MRLPDRPSSACMQGWGWGAYGCQMCHGSSDALCEAGVWQAGQAGRAQLVALIHRLTSAVHLTSQSGTLSPCSTLPRALSPRPWRCKETEHRHELSWRRSSWHVCGIRARATKAEPAACVLALSAFLLRRALGWPVGWLPAGWPLGWLASITGSMQCATHIALRVCAFHNVPGPCLCSIANRQRFQARLRCIGSSNFG